MEGTPTRAPACSPMTRGDARASPPGTRQTRRGATWQPTAPERGAPATGTAGAWWSTRLLGAAGGERLRAGALKQGLGLAPRPRPLTRWRGPAARPRPGLVRPAADGRRTWSRTVPRRATRPSSTRVSAYSLARAGSRAAGRAPRGEGVTTGSRPAPGRPGVGMGSINGHLVAPRPTVAGTRLSVHVGPLSHRHHHHGARQTAPTKAASAEGVPPQAKQAGPAHGAGRSARTTRRRPRPRSGRRLSRGSR